MDRAALERIEREIDQEAKSLFPGNAVERVAVLQYGDDPMVEPGELAVRVFIKAGGTEDDEQAVDNFAHTHKAAMKQLREELMQRLPEAKRLEFTFGDAGDDRKHTRFMMRTGGLGERERERAGGELTPVMARLGPVDLETLDALITAGIAPNRAEAVRWALARIRERPAYAKLRERVREIDELKAQF
jgi:hypothetical protein